MIVIDLIWQCPCRIFNHVKSDIRFNRTTNELLLYIAQICQDSSASKSPFVIIVAAPESGHPGVYTVFSNCTRTRFHTTGALEGG